MLRLKLKFAEGPGYLLGLTSQRAEGRSPRHSPPALGPCWLPAGRSGLQTLTFLVSFSNCLPSDINWAPSPSSPCLCSDVTSLRGMCDYYLHLHLAPPPRVPSVPILCFISPQSSAHHLTCMLHLGVYCLSPGWELSKG